MTNYRCDRSRGGATPIFLRPYGVPACCETDLDLSSLTNLMSMSVELHSTVQLEFPTQLKELGVDDSLQLGRTNVSHVQFVCFDCFGSNNSITEEVLWMLPKGALGVTRTAVKNVLF